MGSWGKASVEHSLAAGPCAVQLGCCSKLGELQSASGARRAGAEGVMPHNLGPSLFFAALPALPARRSENVQRPIPLPLANAHAQAHATVPHDLPSRARTQEFDQHGWTRFTPHYIVWICPMMYRTTEE